MPWNVLPQGKYKENHGWGSEKKHCLQEWMVNNSIFMKLKDKQSWFGGKKKIQVFVCSRDGQERHLWWDKNILYPGRCSRYIGECIYPSLVHLLIRLLKKYHRLDRLNSRSLFSKQLWGLQSSDPVWTGLVPSMGCMGLTPLWSRVFLACYGVFPMRSPSVCVHVPVL